MVFKPKKKEEKANDNENKQNPTNSETKQKPYELLTSHLRKENEKEEQQQAKQSILEQTASDVNKQNEEYHSRLRWTGKKIAIGGVALGVFGGVLFAGSMFYLPLAGFGLFGIGLATIGGPLFFAGVVTWTAGLIGEAWHNHLVQKAQEKEKKEGTREERGR